VSPPGAPQAPPDRPRRSLIVTLAGWLGIAAGGLTLPVALVALLMLLAGGDGTAHTGWLEALLVIGGPPVLLATGIGLLRRRRWAHLGALALLVAFAGHHVLVVLRGPVPEHTITSPTGVPTTVSASPVDYPRRALAIVAALALLAKLLSRPVRAEFGAARSPSNEGGRGRRAEASRGWRVGHQGRDEMYYEELRDGRWQRLRISGELLTGRAHHAIFFASPAQWREYPEWARLRRDEIIARIQSEFRAPDYEYYGEPSARAEAGSADDAGERPALSLPAEPAVRSSSAPPAAARPRAVGATPSAWRALSVAVASLFGLALGAGWLVWNGLEQGETWLPTRLSASRRTLLRAEEPALFWASLGVYAALGLLCCGLGAYLLREGRRLRAGERAGERAEH